jgi:predicted alpha-1,6-mannanase (GH76 family)
VSSAIPQHEWAERAAAAERSVLTRSVRRLWCLPGTRLGVISWPAGWGHRLFLGWNYWWQAHLLDCVVDAAIRDPGTDRRALASRIARGIRIANGGRRRNSYYDDMAWLALALQRSDLHIGTHNRSAVLQLAATIHDGWSDAEGGGVPWRVGDVFKNVPANGPAAILAARTGHIRRAVETADWIDARLRDPATDLIWDGLRPDPAGGTLVERTIYTYCQGVVLGADTELAARAADGADRFAARVCRLVAAVEAELSTVGVLRGHAGGDSGLFSGILARYLAVVAHRLPGDSAEAALARRTARELVLTSADAAWRNAARVDDHGPTFGPDWSRPAVPPAPGWPPERDLSVQLSGWMLMEAAAATTANASGPIG